MTKQEKKQWILDYIRDESHKDIFFDVVSEEFVLDYIDACEPKQVYGTACFVPKVPELGRYLSELYKEGLLKRYVHGCTYTQDGFPKWVYVYNLKEK